MRCKVNGSGTKIKHVGMWNSRMEDELKLSYGSLKPFASGMQT